MKHLHSGHVSVRVCCGFLSVCLFSIPGQSLVGASSPRIHIHSNPPFFSPNQLTSFSEVSLTWENRTREAHSIIADDCQSRSTCSFDSGIIRPDHRFVLSRMAPGRYPYHCGLHPFMRGMVIIRQSPSPSSDHSSDI